MLPIFRDGPPVQNVDSGQDATLLLDVGPRYLAVRLIATVSKTESSATEPSLDEAIGQILVQVNSDTKRTITLASYLNAIQTKWNARLAATLYSKTANDLITTVNDSGSDPVTRTSTWVIDIWFAEPTRDSYSARKAFGWPTVWNNTATGNFPANYTAKIGFVISIPSGSSLSNPAMRCEILTDNVTGALVTAAGSKAGPGMIPLDVLAAAGIVGPNVGEPVMPITHWYKMNPNYSSTALSIFEWPFSGGSIQELDLFCQSGDDVAKFDIQLDNAINRNTTKASNDQLNLAWGWNSAYGSGTAGINYPAADLCSIAFDFTDDPGDALSTANFRKLQLDLTLTDAAASNKTIPIIAQVYRNGLLL